MTLGFPKAHRLLAGYQYRRLAKKGKRTSGALLSVETLVGSPSSRTKLGLTVSRKYGKAFLRNRFKRCVRESFRHLLPRLQPGLQINVAPKAKADGEVEFARVQRELGRLLAPYLISKLSCGGSDEDTQNPSERAAAESC